MEDAYDLIIQCNFMNDECECCHDAIETSYDGITKLILTYDGRFVCSVCNIEWFQ
jgi:hypothetical protein